MSNKIITLDGLNTFLSNVKTYLTELLLSKQDKLISGENIVTVNGNSILTSDNVIAGNIGTVDTDLEIIDHLSIEPIIGYSKEYLTIQSLEDNNEVSFSINNIMYQPEGSNTWSTLNTGEKLILNTNQEVKFKMNNPQITIYGVGTFSVSKKYNVKGNMMSLLYGDDFIGKTDLTEIAQTISDPVPYKLFKESTTLIDAGNLILPATTLANNCYWDMFNGCTSLITAPELPATTLANYCYNHMFYGCTSLITAPELPATTLANNCYYGMFSSCTNLTTAPELPATTLAEKCYYYMFSSCINLTTAPKLPATTLTEFCYSFMFNGCTSLTTAPELPATTLAASCYANMFWNCTSLTTAPELPATILVGYCYNNMFNNCTSLTTAPELPATILAAYCYYRMFANCNKLNYIKMLATDISAYECLYYWVNGVSSTGTFVKNRNATWNVTGVNGIPEGWTVETV